MDQSHRLLEGDEIMFKNTKSIETCSLEEILLREDLEFVLIAEDGFEIREYEDGTREIIAKGRSLFIERKRKEREMKEEVNNDTR